MSIYPEFDRVVDIYVVNQPEPKFHDKFHDVITDPQAIYNELLDRSRNRSFFNWTIYRGFSKKEEINIVYREMIKELREDKKSEEQKGQRLDDFRAVMNAKMQDLPDHELNEKLAILAGIIGMNQLYLPLDRRNK